MSDLEFKIGDKFFFFSEGKIDDAMKFFNKLAIVVEVKNSHVFVKFEGEKENVKCKIVKKEKLKKSGILLSINKFFEPNIIGCLCKGSEEKISNIKQCILDITMQQLLFSENEQTIKNMQNVQKIYDGFFSEAHS